MSVVQPQLSLVLRKQAQPRRVRRPFHPSQGQGSYRLPHDVHDRLVAALGPFRNREAAYALAVFIARFWTVPEEQRRTKSARPGHVPGTFALDRRKLAEHPDLDLTEKQIRSATDTLEKIGFLKRYFTSGSTHILTDEGELHRKPIIFQIGSEYAPMFRAANERAAAARGGDFRSRRASIAPRAQSASTGLPEARTRALRAAQLAPAAPPPKGPKGTAASESSVHMGPLVQPSGNLPKASESDPKLEAALERLWQGVIGEAGGS